MSKTDYTAASKALASQHEASPQTSIQKHKAFLDARLRQISKWVTQGVRPEALVRFCLMEMSRDSKLAACTPESIYLALLACAVCGLEPGSLRGEAYIIAYGGKATFVAGYRGLIKQARRSREVVGLHANIVCEQDEFSIDLGTGNTVVHKPARRDRGEVIGAYAIATLVGGHHEIEWLDREDLDAIRRQAESRGKSPAWTAWPEEMQKKSSIRRLCKRLPLGADFYVASALDHAEQDGTSQKAILDIETDGAASNAESQAAAAPHLDEPAFDPEGIYPEDLKS